MINVCVNVGSLVMEHPGTHPLPIQGKPTIFGGVNGSIGMWTACCVTVVCCCLSWVRGKHCIHLCLSVLVHVVYSLYKIIAYIIVHLYYYYRIGIIFQLEPSVFELLSRLEKKMSHVIKSVGNIEHEVYPMLQGFFFFRNIDQGVNRDCLNRGGGQWHVASTVSLS